MSILRFEGISATLNGQNVAGPLAEELSDASFEPHVDLLTYIGGEAIELDDITGLSEVPEPPVRTRGDESVRRFHLEPEAGFRIHQRTHTHPSHPNKRVK